VLHLARSVYSYISEQWKRPYEGEHGKLMKQRLMEWRRQPSIVRVEKPTRIDKARRLGYKAKVGFVVVRVRVRKGGLRKPRPNSGRRPKRMGIYGHSPKKSLRLIAEERAARKYRNLEVLNSYYVGEDGLYKYYEVILVDPNHPAILNDPDTNWISNSSQHGRVFRGKTAAGRKARGLQAIRGLKSTHKYKWKKKTKEREYRKRHEASRGSRLIVPKELHEELSKRD
jgi:large subunit ribosomal protein L15e